MENQNNKYDKSNKDEVDLKEAFKIIGRRKWWFIVTVIIVIVAGMAFTFIQPVYCKVGYQVFIEENYPNSNLTRLYPGNESSLNSFNSDNLPSTFKSTAVFESLKELSPTVDFIRLLRSDDVTIQQTEKANIFDIEVSYTDCNMANKIALTLIDSIDAYIIEENKKALNNIINQIDADIEGYELKNKNLESEILVLEEEIDALYGELYNFIVDYNIELAAELKKSDEADYTHYSIVIPPNKIGDEISYLREEINIYKEKIVDNKSNQLDLISLKETLINDEAIITDRIDVLSDEPVYSSDNRRQRNIIFVVFLAVIAGVIVVFIANFLLSIKVRKK